MGNEDAVLLEITDDAVIVEMDGIRSEVRGREAVLGVKRIVATQLLHAIASVPSRREMEREREKAMADQNAYARANGLGYQDTLTGVCGQALPAGDIARAINRSRY